MAHDPWTMIFRFPSPLSHRNKQLKMRFWEPLFEIWHVDPETDGSDSSCQHRLQTNHNDSYIHTCWRFWHWRLRFPVVHTLIRWIRDRCGLCGKPFGMFAGVCGHLGSSKHAYHPECYDIVCKRFLAALHKQNPCEFMFGDGEPCPNIADSVIAMMDEKGNFLESKRCWHHIPRKSATRPLQYGAPIKVNGM